jgi:hypothetical protein
MSNEHSRNGNSNGNQFDTTFEGNERRQQSDHAIRIALLEQSMESIKVQLKGINENMSKLVWLVLTALIVAVLKLIIIP